MSTLFVLLALFACAGAATGGAWLTRWRIRRHQEIADSEDLRDTQIRELLAEVKVRSQDAVLAKQAAETAGAENQDLQAQIEDLNGQLEAARQLAGKSESMLKDEINEKTELRESLHKQKRENDGLATRAQELELELRMSDSGAQLLDPALQMEPS
jgi:hypothetical protein